MVHFRTEVDRAAKSADGPHRLLAIESTAGGCSRPKHVGAVAANVQPEGTRRRRADARRRATTVGPAGRTNRRGRDNQSFQPIGKWDQPPRTSGQ